MALSTAQPSSSAPSRLPVVPSMPENTAAISVRNLDRETYDQFRRGAAARGITQAEYLRRLVALQNQCRMEHADGILNTVGLNPITA